MPIYEYQCSQCDAVTEVFQQFSDKPRTICDQCGGRVHKLISQSTFHLKGSGWYVTDYANKKPAADKSEDASQKSSPKNTSKKESTPPT